MKSFSKLFMLIFSLFSILTAVNAQNDLVDIVIIHTADEHGWIDPFTPSGSETTSGGAAVIYDWWVENENYDPEDDSFLLLSGGDNWTGPAISTWFEGQPMVEIMNQMGYDASTIGNHEFDFGRDALAQRLDEAEFPYVSANIRFADDDAPVDFVEPYTIVEANGVQVGIIGLTTTSTPQTTHPVNITDLIFTSYVDELELYVPQMRDAGAEIILVTSHVCVQELTQIARELDVQVDAMFAGHCNQFTDTTVNNIPILGGGWAWRSYARLTIQYDTASDSIINFDSALVSLDYETAPENEDILVLVAPWQSQLEDVLGSEIGYLSVGIERQSWMQGNWVTDAWLWAYPSADIAVTNWGGFRQETVSGSVTMGDIVGLLPFENRIVEIEITGAQLAENLLAGGGAVGGIRYEILVNGTAIDVFGTHQGRNAEIVIEFLDGRPFELEATYTVLISDFMYAGGDNYLFAEHDPDGYETGVQWRQPVIDWTIEQASSEVNGLENFIDSASRGPSRN